MAAALLSGCSSGAKLIVQSDSIPTREAKKRLKFWVPNSQHLIQLNHIAETTDSLSGSSSESDTYPYFQASMKAQAFRPEQVTIGDRVFLTPKGQVIPATSIDGDWTENVFGKQQTIAMIQGEDTLGILKLYLPSEMEATLDDKHPDSLLLTWKADQENPFGVFVQCVAIRGPQLGYPGALKSHMVNYLVDDTDGRFLLSRSMLPAWIWEDEEHTSFEIAVFRRNTDVAKMREGKGSFRVVSTQGQQFQILPVKQDL